MHHFTYSDYLKLARSINVQINIISLIYIYYIKESLFNYIYIYIYMCVCVCVSGEVTREPGYVAKIFYTRS